MRKLSLKEKGNLRLAAVRHAFGNVQLSDGSLATFQGEQLNQKLIGQSVWLIDGSNDWFVLADGSYLTMNQQPFTIENGVLKSVGTAQITNNQSADRTNKQLQSKIKQSKMSNNLLDAEIQAAYARMKHNGDTGESLESFSKKFQPTPENNINGMFEQAAKVRDLNAKKANANMTFDAKPATSNLTDAQKAEYLAEANALGIKTFVETPAEKYIAAKVKEDLDIYVNLSREEEQTIKDRIIAKAKVEFEQAKREATNIKNKLPKDMTPLERIIAERGW
jgi:hypothetical protein